MIELVDRAEKHLEGHDAWTIEWPSPAEPKRSARLEIAALRRAVSDAAHAEAQGLGFARRSDVLELSQRGGATPDHVIRTKRVPLVGRDVAAFCAAYEQYVQAHAATRKLAAVDPAPRVILDPELGLCVVGRTADEAAVAEDIYRHTIDIIMRAERLGGWQALPARDFFDVEYWEMERAKLEKGGREPMFLVEIALVTGAADRGCARAGRARLRRAGHVWS